MITPAVSSLSLPEVIFGVMVLVCFAAFAVTLASVHLYVSLAPRRRRAPERVAHPAAVVIDALAGEII
jgi:hypothetical protein